MVSLITDSRRTVHALRCLPERTLELNQRNDAPVKAAIRRRRHNVTGLLMTVAVVLSLLLSACSSGPSSLTKVTLRQEWFPNANYAGALFAKKVFAAEHNIAIQVDAGSDQIDPV